MIPRQKNKSKNQSKSKDQRYFEVKMSEGGTFNALLSLWIISRITSACKAPIVVLVVPEPCKTRALFHETRILPSKTGN